MSLPILTFVAVVDTGKKPSQRHRTAGRYYVGAKNEKEATKLLKEAIKFGSVQILGTSDKCDTYPISCKHKQIIRAVGYDEEARRQIVEPFVSVY